MRESRTSGSEGGPGDLVSTVELGTHAAIPKGRRWKPFTYGDGTPVYPDMMIRARTRLKGEFGRVAAAVPLQRRLKKKRARFIHEHSVWLDESQKTVQSTSGQRVVIDGPWCS